MHVLHRAAVHRGMEKENYNGGKEGVGFSGSLYQETLLIGEFAISNWQQILSGWNPEFMILKMEKFS